MFFDDRSYSVLIVSASEKFNQSVLPLLPQSRYEPIAFSQNAAAAKRALLERNYDIILVNTPLPDEFGTRLAAEAGSEGSGVVLLIVKGEALEEVRSKVLPQGIFTIEKPISVNAMERALSWLATARERLRRAENKTLSVEEKMAEIRLINRAKWVLIEHRDMTEPEAHRQIEKEAMDRCISKKRVAEEIVAAYADES